VNNMRSNSIRTFLLASLLAAVATSSFAGVDISITVAPPILPVYTQPVIPGDGYLWTPGDWGYGAEGYFWVPGTWVLPPRPGVLWTPGYWGFAGGFYGWHAGYWGPHIGFYGGVNYGFGYGGVGFFGGRWEGGHFAYNTAVSNVNVTVIHNTYVDKTVINNNAAASHASFNGPNGVKAEPSAQERTAMNEQHAAPTQAQAAHEHAASADRTQLASVNHGKPANAAVSRPIAPANAQAKGQAKGQGPANAQAKAPQQKAKAANKPAPKPAERPAEEKR
jgi:hypothetical protein